MVTNKQKCRAEDAVSFFQVVYQRIFTGVSAGTVCIGWASHMNSKLTVKDTESTLFFIFFSFWNLSGLGMDFVTPEIMCRGRTIGMDYPRYHTSPVQLDRDRA